jgi:hypothetical protein
MNNTITEVDEIKNFEDPEITQEYNDIFYVVFKEENSFLSCEVEIDDEGVKITTKDNWGFIGGKKGFVAKNSKETKKARMKGIIKALEATINEL